MSEFYRFVHAKNSAQTNVRGSYLVLSLYL